MYAENRPICLKLFKVLAKVVASIEILSCAQEKTGCENAIEVSKVPGPEAQKHNTCSNQ